MSSKSNRHQCQQKHIVCCCAFLLETRNPPAHLWKASPGMDWEERCCGWGPCHGWTTRNIWFLKNKACFSLTLSSSSMAGHVSLHCWQGIPAGLCSFFNIYLASGWKHQEDDDDMQKESAVSKKLSEMTTRRVRDQDLTCSGRRSTLLQNKLASLFWSLGWINTYEYIWQINYDKNVGEIEALRRLMTDEVSCSTWHATESQRDP